MPISDIVALTITAAAAGPTRAGFGVPMLLGYSQRFPERLRFYTSSADMVADGFLTTDPEYIAATQLEAQNPRVEKWAVGRGNNRPTQSLRLTVLAIQNATKYAVKVDGVEVSYTSDANATQDEIRTGLAAAIDAAQAKMDSQPMDVGVAWFDLLAAAPGTFTSIEVLDRSLLAANDQHADPGVAADLAAIELYNPEWYALAIAGAVSEPLTLAAAAWAESAKKLFGAGTSDTVAATTGAAGGDVLDTLKTTNYGQSFGTFHPSPQDFYAVALMGARLPFDPGSETWKFARVAGVATVKLTPTEQANLNAKNANYIYEVAGVSFNAEGKVAAGEWIDVVRGLAWLEARIGERTFGAFVNGTAKIPYTDKGAGVLAGAVRSALEDGVDSGLLREDPAPLVAVPKVADVSTDDRNDRHLPGVTFSAELAGAIHKVSVRGQVSA